MREDAASSIVFEEGHCTRWIVGQMIAYRNYCFTAIGAQGIRVVFLKSVARLT